MKKTKTIKYDVHRTGARRKPSRKSIFCENNIWRSDNFGFRTVEIRKFHLISTKNTWYNLKIPAPAIDDRIPTN